MMGMLLGRTMGGTGCRGFDWEGHDVKGNGKSVGEGVTRDVFGLNGNSLRTVCREERMVS
jgi:hypothetical protein